MGFNPCARACTLRGTGGPFGGVLWGFRLTWVLLCYIYRLESITDSIPVLAIDQHCLSRCLFLSPPDSRVSQFQNLSLQGFVHKHSEFELFPLATLRCIPPTAL